MGIKGTTHFDPVFEYWRQFPALKVCEIASMMRGFEPRTLGDIVDRDGDGPDLSDEVRILTDAVLTGELVGYEVTDVLALSDLKISTASLIPWLRKRGLHSMADELQASPVSGANASGVPLGGSLTPSPPISRAAVQDAAILAALNRLGVDPLNLPKNERGKTGVKALVRRALGHKDIWAGSTVFDKAWERLSKGGSIRYLG